jgi:hypothetical protein
LIVKGNSAEAAMNATNALVDYCCNQKVMPHDLIDAELATIHPGLTPTSLALLKDIESSLELSPQQVREKSALHATNKKISEKYEHIKSTLPVFLLILCFFIANISCGIKSGIRSEVLDYRPEIPFHHKAASSQQEPKKDDQHEEADL